MLEIEIYEEDLWYDEIYKDTLSYKLKDTKKDIKIKLLLTRDKTIEKYGYKKEYIK